MSFLRRRWVRLGLGPGLAAGPGIIAPFVGGWGSVSLAVLSAGGLGLVVGSSVVLDKDRAAAESRADARATINLLLNGWSSALARGVDPAVLRLNIMTVDPAAGALRFAYGTSGYSDLERDLEWRREEGAVGRAWLLRQTVIYPEDGERPVTSDDATKASRPWGMREQQIITTADRVKVVIATPVADPTDVHGILGVLSADLDREVGRPVMENLGAVLEDARSALGGLLAKADGRRL